MVIGILHWVVWYFVVQKITKPMMDHYLNTSTRNKLNICNMVAKTIKLKIISKSVHQIQTKGAYIVMGCPLPLSSARV